MDLTKLVLHLCELPSENEWLEFKHNNFDAEMIGKDISALANSATYYDKPNAYMIWGVDDATHEIVGTDFTPTTAKVGNQNLEMWLRQMLTPNAEYNWHNCLINEKPVCILMIKKAFGQTVMFKKTEYIRVGSNTKMLNDVPSMKSTLWNKIKNNTFEGQIAKAELSLVSALQLLDYTSYFDAKKESVPTDAEGIVHFMLQESFILQQDNGLYAITNLGAILYAKRLEDFPSLERKALRIVQYKGNNKLEMLKEETFNKGYASAFEGAIKYIEALIPTVETIVDGLRKKVAAYSILAVREAVANSLIHQDFFISGTGPTVEIFDKRIEITNPGTPLVDIYRIVDNPPKSRNEKLASIMRRLGICEEMGSGWDKMVISCELLQLPTPKICVYDESTRVFLYTEMPFTNLAPEDKIWACYMHACIKQVQGEQLTNSSLRERFGLQESSSGSISRLIKDAVQIKIIKPLDPNTAPRYMKYIPIWA